LPCYAFKVKLLILYRPNSEHAREVETFVHEFQRRHDVGKKIELLSVDTREGVAEASLYDILAFPAILALADNGSVLNTWVGMPLPLMNDVAGHAYSG
jgi:hypothetical protein